MNETNGFNVERTGQHDERDTICFCVTLLERCVEHVTIQLKCVQFSWSDKDKNMVNTGNIDFIGEIHCFVGSKIEKLKIA